MEKEGGRRKMLNTTLIPWGQATTIPEYGDRRFTKEII
jgi:hypothetical protein